MNFLFRRIRGLDAPLVRALGRRPEPGRRVVRYGWAFLLAVGALVAAGGAVAAGRDGQQIVYATEDGSVVSLEPESGRRATVYAGEGFAAGPSRTGGPRFLAFTVLRDEGAGLRGDLYSVDLGRQTRALTGVARPGEVLLGPEFSPARTAILANRYAEGSAPNALVLAASGATEHLVEPDLPGSPALVAPAWTWENTVHAWQPSAGGDGLALVAREVFERRQATLYETAGEVGPVAYYPDANALLFAERPRGGGAEDSRLVVLVGTSKLSVSGTEGLGVYDPSPPIPALGGKVAVLWTDGERTGLGFVDPDGWRFEKAGVEVERGSRHPHLSRDGTRLATSTTGAAGGAGDAEGAELVVRRTEDGRVIRRVRGLQPPHAALDRMRRAGIEVPPEAYRFAPANFGWRDIEDGYAEAPQGEAP